MSVELIASSAYGRAIVSDRPSYGIAGRETKKAKGLRTLTVFCVAMNVVDD